MDIFSASTIVELTNPLISTPLVLVTLWVFTIWAGIVDIKTLKIRNRFNLVFLLTGLSFMGLEWLGQFISLPSIVPTLSFGWTNFLGMLAGFFFIFIPAFAKNHPMGGDIKMSAVLGFWLGFGPLLYVLIFATIFNFAYWFGALYVYKDYGSKTLMPFAPFFALGVMVLYGLGYFL